MQIPTRMGKDYNQMTTMNAIVILDGIKASIVNNVD